MRIIENDLGLPLEAVFSYISEKPVAAASLGAFRKEKFFYFLLGQVYRAKLRKTGQEVAIKVQRPGIEPIIYRQVHFDLLLPSIPFKRSLFVSNVGAIVRQNFTRTFGMQRTTHRRRIRREAFRGARLRSRSTQYCRIQKEL